MGTLLQHQPPSALGSRRADDREAARPRELDGPDAHAAARPVDQEGLASLTVAAVEEGVEGGGVRDVHRRALPEAGVGGQGMDLRRLAERQLGVSARDRATHVDAIPGFTPVTAEPTVSTTPAVSEPGV